ncbi:hypothetical protein [Pontibacter sp. G13]|uniref:hypothetical protein n=1 Tax=Pontibacter sp. G13 TaxID=3074898 RepID=UPI002889C2BB|nr:hypothetical protein [Pontibacter sp. G13]WNJ19300.1 hypothetical protein RJD25_02310 [Pontibacter sp. G13]
MTSSVVYFDSEYAEECAQFCATRYISSLPDISQSGLYHKYNRETEEFTRTEIPPEQIVHPMEDIFQHGMVEKFQTYELLFVMEHGSLLGVVHFSDYNRPEVYEEVYQKLYKLERGLIFLIVEYAEKKREDLIEFAQGKPARKDLELAVTRRDFSIFKMTLKEIMAFSSAIELLNINAPEKITLLRNRIAHSEDLVRREDYRADPFQYHYKSFDQLVTGKLAIEKALKQVSNRLYFMQAVLDEDFTLRTDKVFDRAFQ